MRVFRKKGRKKSNNGNCNLTTNYANEINLIRNLFHLFKQATPRCRTSFERQEFRPQAH